MRTATSSTFAVRVMIAIFILLLCSKTQADEPKRVSRGLKACIVQWMQKSNGDAGWVYTKIYVVGEVEGKDEWWIQIVGSPYYDKEGRQRAVNWSKDTIVFYGKSGEVKRGETKVKTICPQGLW